MSITIPRPAAGSEPAAPAARSAISVEDVSKTFRLPRQQYSTLKERALHPFRARTFDELRALKSTSLEIADGEFFGIVGRNGSGKSTLLKCIAGIYGVDSGRIVITGRLSPFIELGVGFNMDLTARDNVIINAIMLGLGRKEAAARFDRVIAFAELEEFIDLKLKNYSSGMLVRLAFATAIQVDADILLIDEVLAVGDAAFQQKCFEEFFRLKRERKTIVFVSHDMHSVERFCDRALLLERGEMVMLGKPQDIGRAYHKLNFGQLPHEAPQAPAASVPADGAVESAQPAKGTQPTLITDAWFESSSSERTISADQNEPFTMCFEVQIGEDLVDPVFASTLRTEQGHTIVVARSDKGGERSGSYRAGETVIARFDVPNWLAASRYTMTPSIAHEGTGTKALSLIEDMALIHVLGYGGGGIFEMPIDVRIERL